MFKQDKGLVSIIYKELVQISERDMQPTGIQAKNIVSRKDT